ncbi:MAG: hypothetical protein F2663_04430 [Actinobacteria bacterium]|uniref:Unannotated protein n=1 Tax=freshwater metagenome TaxID=449393 RepID=A0A6J6P3H6_9ZZZZ|nr:hypothetical protein [Actinomycetota bacterium]
MSYFLIPLIILIVLVVLMGIIAFLSRFRKGRYLRPIIVGLAKIGWIRRMFEKASQAQIERSQPELASALRKLKRLGPNPDPRKVHQALMSLTVAERRAYMEAQEAQVGSQTEPMNRQLRRGQSKIQSTTKPGSAGRKSRRRK